MRLTIFEAGGRKTYGVLEDNVLREPGNAFRSRYTDLRSLTLNFSRSSRIRIKFCVSE